MAKMRDQGRHMALSLIAVRVGSVYPICSTAARSTGIASR